MVSELLWYLNYECTYLKYEGTAKTAAAPSVNFAIRLTTSGVATVSANTVPNVAPMAGILE